MLKEIYELWQSIPAQFILQRCRFFVCSNYTTKKSYPTARPIATFQAYGLKTIEQYITTPYAFSCQECHGHSWTLMFLYVTKDSVQEVEKDQPAHGVVKQWLGTKLCKWSLITPGRTRFGSCEMKGRRQWLHNKLRRCKSRFSCPDCHLCNIYCCIIVKFLIIIKWVQ